MPRRVKVDRGPIFRSLERTQSASLTAVELGLHYNTVRQIFRLGRGLCMRCGKAPHQTGATKCKRCADWDRDRTADKRRIARSEGRCSMCPAPLKVGSTLYCVEHQQMTLERQRHFRLKGYGPEAMPVWKAANGLCQACGKPRVNQTLHVHHIDEDHSNTAASNLVVLCRSCHYMAHCLLNSRDRRAFIKWFVEAYPALALSD